MAFEVNDRVRELRRVLDLSQIEFCEKIGLKQGTLSDIERKRINVSPKTAEKIIDNYKVSREWLYTGNSYIFTTNELNSKYGTSDLHSNTSVINEKNIANSDERIKVVTFWRKLLNEDKDIDKTISALSELEGLKMDLDSYIRRLNTVLNSIDKEVLNSDNKTIMSKKYIHDTLTKLAFLKEHYESIHQLNTSIESVLAFVDHDVTVINL